MDHLSHVEETHVADQVARRISAPSRVDSVHGWPFTRLEHYLMPKSSGVGFGTSASTTSKLGFVSCASGAPVGRRPLPATPIPLKNSFDWATTWFWGRHPVVPTGRQLGSFRNLSSEGTVR
ncbi:MAG: hypothetical protein WA734_11975 [Candidatus Acidiferrales bacterium]